MSRKILSSCVLAGVVIFSTSPSSYAQGAMGLEEVVVTARKREESLQDTPISVTAMQAGDIEARSMVSLSDLSSFAPNLEINNGRGDSGSANAAIFIRGVGQNDFIFPTDPGVGLYVDGIYVARSLGGMMDLADIERIEVLRGPQGTLYGKNTIGGAVNIITTKPGEETEGVITATVGEDNRRDFVGRVNFPLIENTLYGKLAFAAKNQDGYVSRVDGLDLGDTNVDVYRGALRWLASESVDVNLALDYSKIDQHGSPGSFISSFDTPAQQLYNGVAAGFVSAQRGLPAGSVIDDRWNSGDIYRSSGTGSSFDKNESGGVHITVDWSINDNLTLKSISAYRKMDADVAVDMDHTPFSIVETNQRQEQDQFSQELQLSGTTFEGKLNWLLGAYYFSEEAEDVNQTLLVSGLFSALNAMPADFVPLTPGSVCPGGTDLSMGHICVGGAGNPFNAQLDFDVRPITSLDAETTALFTHITYDISDSLSATIGGRFTWEEKEYFIDSVYPASGKVAVSPTRDTQDWSEFTPKLGLDYQINDDMMMYVSYSEGFKSGGWNPRVLSPEEYARYDQESLSTWELGFKSTLLDNHLRLNAAVFSTDYEELQLTSNVISPTTGGLLLIVQNAGEVSIQGAELEVTAKPTDALDLQIGLGYLDGEYDQLSNAISWNINNELPDAPKLTANIAIQYTMELNDMGSLVWRLDGSYKDKTYKDPFNVAAITQGDYWLSNARITWLNQDESWKAALFVVNLGDKEYITSGTSVAAFGINTANFGRPRQWGMSLSYQF